MRVHRIRPQLLEDIPPIFVGHGDRTSDEDTRVNGIVSEKRLL